MATIPRTDRLDGPQQRHAPEAHATVFEALDYARPGAQPFPIEDDPRYLRAIAVVVALIALLPIVAGTIVVCTMLLFGIE